MSDIPEDLKKMLKTASISEESVKELEKAMKLLVPLERFLVNNISRECVHRLSALGPERMKLGIDALVAHLVIFEQFSEDWTPEKAERLSDSIKRQLFKNSLTI